MTIEIRISLYSVPEGRSEIVRRILTGDRKHAFTIARRETRGTTFHASVWLPGTGVVAQYLNGKRVASEVKINGR